MLGSIGIPELLVIAFIAGICIVPVLLVVWVVLTLHRARTRQDELQANLDEIARRIQPS